MDEGNSFLELIKRSLRAADPSAAVELVRRYEPAIRRIVRLQMQATPACAAYLDSMDVCQSVLASFFIRAATGQYDLNHPAQHLRLLAVMARNKVASQARTSYVMRREPALCGAADASTAALAPEPGPDHQAAWRDLLQEVRGWLSDDERRLADRRAERREWSEIATELGGSPEALRKELAGALYRVSHQLGLDLWRHG